MPELRVALGLLLATAPVLAQPASEAGDAERGRALVADRQAGLCTLCHAVPGVPAHLSGNLGPPLAGVASRLTAERLRAQLLAPRTLNPDSIMPAYGPTEGLQQVASAWAGRPLFTPVQQADVLAYLQTLR